MRLLGLAVVATASLGTLGTAYAAEARLDASRGEFRLRLADGRLLEKRELIGAVLVMGAGRREARLRIDDVQEAPAAPGGPVTLYSLSQQGSDGTFRNVCNPDAEGRRAGFPLSRPHGFTFTCTSGAVGKCVLLGYRPWASGPEAGGVPMRDLHAACIHMVRADYGGDGRPGTRDGTLIDVYDRYGVQRHDGPGLAFEAAWGRRGAICVAHPRIPEVLTLKDLAARYPALRGRLGETACTEEAMQADPRVLLFNRSALKAP